MHTQHNVHRQDHKSKVNQGSPLVEPPPPELYQGSMPVEPPLELLKSLLMKLFTGSSEAVCEGYRMSKRVHRKLQSKVKSLESEPYCCSFSPGTGKFGQGVAPNDQRYRR
jgi:hypothetical protein